MAGPVIMKPSDYFVPSGYEGVKTENAVLQDQEVLKESSLATFADTYCHSCRVHLTSISQAEMHYKGAKHRQKLRLLEEKNQICEDEAVEVKRAKIEICDVCNVKLLTPAVAEPHYNGEKHRKKLSLLQSMGLSECRVAPSSPAKCMPANPPKPHSQHRPPQSQPSGQQGNKAHFYCPFCNLCVNSLAQMEAHRSGSKHKTNVEKSAAPLPPRAANPMACSMTYSQVAYPQTKTICNRQYAQGMNAPGQYMAQY